MFLEVYGLLKVDHYLFGNSQKRSTVTIRYCVGGLLHFEPGGGQEKVPHWEESTKHDAHCRITFICVHNQSARTAFTGNEIRLSCSYAKRTHSDGMCVWKCVIGIHTLTRPASVKAEYKE